MGWAACLDKWRVWESTCGKMVRSWRNKQNVLVSSDTWMKSSPPKTTETQETQNNQPLTNQPISSDTYYNSVVNSLKAAQTNSLASHLSKVATCSNTQVLCVPLKVIARSGIEKKELAVCEVISSLEPTKGLQDTHLGQRSGSPLTLRSCHLRVCPIPLRVRTK